MMRNGRLCDVELLEIWNTSPSFNTARYRENYAKQALMMFFPITVVDDLNSNGSHWEKFIAVGGTKCYDAKLDCQDETPAGCMWEYGKRILENVQTRKTVKSKMKRPPDPLALGTKRPQSTGERMKADIDDEITLVTPPPRPKTQQPPQVQPNKIHLLPTRLRQDMGKC
eukprot:scaffold19229_cov91-Skeletonema_dohrnii-CCMP3373.AAC.1